MGCVSSKRIEATVEVYRPPPSSFAVFDINSIQEPWLSLDNRSQENQEKPTNLPAPILEKLNKLESDTPHSWDEVSKALEDLKKPPPKAEGGGAAPEKKQFRRVSFHTHEDIDSKTQPSTAGDGGAQEKKEALIKRRSFHTVEELDSKLKPKPLRKTESRGRVEPATESGVAAELVTEPGNEAGKVIKPVRENIFILRDRQEREKEGKMAFLEKKRFDPLSDYPEKCPPGGADSLVVYTTSLRGVRRTFEDCNRVRTLLEGHKVVFDERDVSLHGEFLNEVRSLLGEEVNVPRLFVKGRYIGGVDEVVELNELGRLGRILSWARVERGVGRQACEGCGGDRFVPCFDCGGSCKVVIDGVKDRCSECNENGLVLCPLCL